MTDKYVDSRPTANANYSDNFIYSNCTLVINTQFDAPSELKSYGFVFVKEFVTEAPGYPCQLQEALEKVELAWMIAGSLKTLSTSKKYGRVIVLDIASPLNLIGVQLRRSESNNWHYDTDDCTREAIEEVNPLEYTYFQSDKFFIALRKNEFEDIFMYVYKKQ